QESAVQSRVADLDNAAETNSAFSSISSCPATLGCREVSQKPARLPKSLGRAVESPRDGSSSQFLGLENREPQDVKRLLGMPAVFGLFYANQVDSVGDLICRLGLLQSSRAPPHAAPSLLLR